MPTQNTNIFNPATPGIEYAGANLKWTIANGVLVGAGVNPGVASAFNGSKLVNRGVVNALDNIGGSFRLHEERHGDQQRRLHHGVPGVGGSQIPTRRESVVR